MGAALATLIPVIVSLITELLRPRGQPSQDEEPMFPRPGWLPPDNLNWAVVGASGAGKSGLTNGIRNIKRDEPGWAPEVNETTQEPTPYPFKERADCKIWDLPGGGTVAHPVESYVRDKGIRWFHGVVICIKDGRPLEFDAYLAKELETYRVPYYVVQNRFQQTCEGEEVDVDDADEVRKLAAKTKDGIYDEFQKRGTTIQLARIFMINSRKWGFADGQHLKDSLWKDLMSGRIS